MHKNKIFKKKIEDFVCNNCETTVKGNGYTNHCPNCLWSKHVDINPGDRKSSCKGSMKPVSLEIKQGDYIIIFNCNKCGATKKNKAAPNDNMKKLIELSIK
jgi:rubrerythrin